MRRKSTHGSRSRGHKTAKAAAPLREQLAAWLQRARAADRYATAQLEEGGGFDLDAILVQIRQTAARDIADAVADCVDAGQSLSAARRRVEAVITEVLEERHLKLGKPVLRWFSYGDEDLIASFPSAVRRGLREAEVLLLPPAVKRGGRPPSRSLAIRRKTIQQVADMKVRGIKYAKALAARALTTPVSWQKAGCPKDYVAAYRDPKWKRQIVKEKTRSKSLPPGPQNSFGD